MTDIALEIADRIATVTIDRPGKRNVMRLSMWREMAGIFKRLSDDPEVRGIILTGAGGNFCAGGDISEYGDVRSGDDQTELYGAAVDACADAIQKSRPPTIAALHGYCLGGGCNLAMACDFRVADATTRIGIPAARLSIVYGVRSTQLLYALVGLSAAKRMLFSAERLDAEEAWRLGFVDRVGSSALDEARTLATSMVDSAPLTIAGAKTILNGLAMGSGTLDIEAAKRLVVASGDSDDYREGCAAFAEKRAPRFTGR